MGEGQKGVQDSVRYATVDVHMQEDCTHRKFSTPEPDKLVPAGQNTTTHVPRAKSVLE